MTTSAVDMLPPDDELARARAAEKAARAERSMADAEALRRDLSFAAHAGGDLLARDKLATAGRVLLDAQLTARLDRIRNGRGRAAPCGAREEVAVARDGPMPVLRAALIADFEHHCGALVSWPLTWRLRFHALQEEGSRLDASGLVRAADWCVCVRTRPFGCDRSDPAERRFGFSRRANGIRGLADLGRGWAVRMREQVAAILAEHRPRRMPHEMPNVLRKLRISEVSAVDRGAGEGARVVLTKRLDSPDFGEAQPNVAEMLGRANARLLAGVWSVVADDGDPNKARSINQLFSAHADFLSESLPESITMALEQAGVGGDGDVTKRAPAMPAYRNNGPASATARDLANLNLVGAAAQTVRDYIATHGADRARVLAVGAMGERGAALVDLLKVAGANMDLVDVAKRLVEDGQDLYFTAGDFLAELEKRAQAECAKDPSLTPAGGFSRVVTQTRDGHDAVCRAPDFGQAGRPPARHGRPEA